MEVINISGEIGWQVQPDEIRDKFKALNGKDVDIQIASPGGFVFDGIEIFNIIRDYKRDYPQAQIMITLKGLAASMASYIAMNPAADMVVAEDNAVFMIHNPYGGVVGDYRDMEKMGEVLTGLTDIIAAAYSRKSGKSRKEIKSVMDEEGWYFGSEIKDAGFVDDIIPTPEPQEKLAALAEARLRFKSLSEKLSTRKIDYQQAAAMLKPDENFQGCNHYLGDITSSAPNGVNGLPRTTPALNAGNNTKEVKPMNFDELMAQNPAAKIEFENKLKEQFEAGKKAAYAISAQAAVFAANKEYPEQIRSAAIDVMKGEKGMDFLNALVINVDMIKEMAKSLTAKTESAATGETPGQQPPALSQDGEIRNELDLAAQIKRDRAALGLEVK